MKLYKTNTFKLLFYNIADLSAHVNPKILSGICFFVSFLLRLLQPETLAQPDLILSVSSSRLLKPLSASYSVTQQAPSAAAR